MTTPSPRAASPAMRFGVVDLETSGLDTERHQILQIGLVVVEIDPADHLATEIEHWATMVRLRRPWQRLGPRRVHGIRRRHLRGAPPLELALTELRRRCDGVVFTAHNAAFDGSFLDAAARRLDLDLDLDPRLCTLRLSRRLDPGRAQSHRLVDVCHRYGIPLDRPHDALEDARATASILPHLLAAHGITCVDQLSPFYEPHESHRPTQRRRDDRRPDTSDEPGRSQVVP